MVDGVRASAITVTFRHLNVKCVVHLLDNSWNKITYSYNISVSLIKPARQEELTHHRNQFLRNSQRRQFTLHKDIGILSENILSILLALAQAL